MMQQKIIESGEQSSIVITTAAHTFSAVSSQERWTAAGLRGSCQYWDSQSEWHSEGVRLKVAEFSFGVDYCLIEGQR